jgi:hypothetical protein
LIELNLKAGLLKIRLNKASVLSIREDSEGRRQSILTHKLAVLVLTVHNSIFVYKASNTIEYINHTNLLYHYTCKYRIAS